LAVNSATKDSGRSSRRAARRVTLRRTLIVVVLVAIGACAVLFVTARGRDDPAAALKRGQKLFEQHELAGAVIELKNAVRGAPENADARAALGYAYLESANYPAALKELRRARSLGLSTDQLNRSITKALIFTGEVDEAATELALGRNDTSSEWLSLQAHLDMAVGRLEEARSGFERAIEIDPNNVDAHRASVRVAIMLGETEAARAEVDAALRLTQDDYDIWLLKGDLDQHDKKFDDAIAAYSRALEITPRSPLALLQRANARAATGDNDGALADLDAIGNASNEDPRALFLRAMIARQQDQDNTALRYLREILVVMPNHRQSLLLAAKIHFEAQEFSQAEEYMDRLLVIDPGNEAYRRMLGSIQLAAGQLDTGLGDMANVNIDDLSDPGLLALLGTAYIRHGEFEQGTRSLERATELAPDSAPIRTQLAFSRLREGKTAEAMEELKAIRKSDPEFLLAGILQAFAYASMKDMTAAYAVTNELIGKHPDEAILLNLRGYLYGSQGEFDKATADFDAALAKDPKFFPANFNLARLAMKRDDAEGAEKQLKAILSRDPNQPQALMYLASIRLAADDQDAALKLWQQARDNNPDAVEPRVMLARYYRSAKDFDRAEALANEAYVLAPYLPAAQLEFAWHKLNRGQAEKALPAIKELVERFPESPQPLEMMARAYEKAGDIESLEATLIELVKKFPENRKAAIALARLNIRQQKLDEALQLAKGLRDKDETVADAYDIEGDVFFLKGELPNAVTAYRKSHEARPDSHSVLKLDAALRRAGHDENLLEAWLNEHPEDAEVRLAMATNDISRDQREQAIANYEKVLQVQPQNTIALNNLAWLFDELGDERALDYARKAYELAPARAEIADTYGWILFRAGQQEQALNILKKAVDGNPVNHDIRYHLASVLAEAGDNAAALKHLDTVLSDDSNFASRADAEKLMQTLRP